jgi:hypothetical protein
MRRSNMAGKSNQRFKNAAQLHWFELDRRYKRRAEAIMEEDFDRQEAALEAEDIPEPYDDDADSYDDILLSDSQARELCRRVTGDGMDCECLSAPALHTITWVWAEKDAKGKTRYVEFRIRVPRRRPMDIRVMASSANHYYRAGAAARRQRAAEVEAAVLKCMGDVLRINLQGYAPDTERADFL